MKKKSLLSIFLLAIFLFSMTTVAFAENWYYVGVPVIRQQKTQWCWAASGEMAGKAVNPSSTRTQSDGVYYVTGGYENYPNTSNAAASVATYVSKNQKRFYVDRGTWTINSIRSEIMDRQSPLITLGGYYDYYGNRNGGHFVVIDAVYEYSNTLRYVDPWDATTHWCSYQAFKDGSYNSRKYEETVYGR